MNKKRSKENRKKMINRKNRKQTIAMRKEVRY